MDTSDSRVQNLLFLLSAAPLSLSACVIVSDDSATTETSSGTSATEGTTDPTPTGSATDMTVTSDATDGPTTDGGSAEDGPADTTTGEPPDLEQGCIYYATFYADCYGEAYYDNALTNCNAAANAFMVYGVDCIIAYADLLACLMSLSCEEFGTDVVCNDEQGAVGKAC